MSSLRVIVVTPEVPDPFGNAAARWFYALAKGLALRGHQVSFFAAYPPTTRRVSLERANALFGNIGVSLRLYPYPNRTWVARKWHTLTEPFSFFLSDELRQDLATARTSGYDILNLEQMWTGYLGVGVDRALLTVHHLELLDLAGVNTQSLKFFASKYLMQHTERRILKSIGNIRVTTERLSREVARINPMARVFTAPVALDPDLYKHSIGESQQRKVGLIANVSWYPGYNAATRLLDRIWPLVKKRVTDARLLIVGWNARQSLKAYLGEPDVTVIENVPDTEAYFRDLSVLAYPLSQGSGMKIKLLEAMAYGTPIVTTSEGAEGLGVVDGQNAFVCDDDEGFVERVVVTLLDGQIRTRLTRAAREFVEREYSPIPVVMRMEKIYEAVMSKS